MHALARRGATLGLVSRSQAELERLAAELPGQHHVLPADVSDREAVFAAVREFGAHDLCVANAGIAGPRFPSACQDVMHFDEVCFDFPELTIVMRHGAEPWDDLAVMLMRKWPNLYYSTSAFAPKRYPSSIIEFANTRTGADKVLFAGYYAVGLSWERIFAELPDLPLKDDVWPRFLRDNALRVLGLGG